MAIAGTHLTTAGNAGSGTSYSTASISPTANALVLVAVTHTIGTGAVPNQASISGAGLTFDHVVSGASANVRTSVFRALSATPSSGALTISFSGQSQDRCIWSVSEFTGIDTGGTNGADAIVQSVTDATTSTSGLITLAAFSSSSNATYGMFRLGSNTAFTAGTGFTLLGQATTSTNMSLMSEWRSDNDTTVTANWDSASRNYRGIGVEIKAAGGVSSTDVGGYIFMSS